MNTRWLIHLFTYIILLKTEKLHETMILLRITLLDKISYSSIRNTFTFISHISFLKLLNIQNLMKLYLSSYTNTVQFSVHHLKVLMLNKQLLCKECYLFARAWTAPVAVDRKVIRRFLAAKYTWKQFFLAIKSLLKVFLYVYYSCH